MLTQILPVETKKEHRINISELFSRSLHRSKGLRSRGMEKLKLNGRKIKSIKFVTFPFTPLFIAIYLWVNIFSHSVVYPTTYSINCTKQSNTASLFPRPRPTYYVKGNSDWCGVCEMVVKKTRDRVSHLLHRHLNEILHSDGLIGWQHEWRDVDEWEMVMDQWMIRGDWEICGCQGRDWWRRWWCMRRRENQGI